MELSIHYRGGQPVAGSVNSKKAQWLRDTSAALSALAQNFPQQVSLAQGAAQGWGELTPQNFPCQSSDEMSRCPGWTLALDRPFAAPGHAQKCPCVAGRVHRFGPLLAVAAEVSELTSLNEIPDATRLGPYTFAENDELFASWIMQWLWKAAQGAYAPEQNASWIDTIQVANLNQPQRQTLRWWSRLLELSTLVHNQRFVLLLRQSVEFIHKKYMTHGHARVLADLGLNESQLVILALDGHELSTAGLHSEKNAWFEAFIGFVDEHCLPLSLIAKQPLLHVENTAQRVSNAEFRWKARHRVDGVRFSLQQVLRRGSWDRLCEALARGEAVVGNL